MSRCSWAESSELMLAYHDTEWGVPSHDDRYLFEMLVLEGAQAGLSWSTVLSKRQNYREALDGFDYDKIAAYRAEDLALLAENPGIIRNRLKIESLVKNASAFLCVREEFGSFDRFLWGWVEGTPILNHRNPDVPPPPRSGLSDELSRDLRRRGFNFVGSTIVYSFLQAVGVVNDHDATCVARDSSTR